VKRRIFVIAAAAALATGLALPPQLRAETALRIATEGAYPPFNMKDKSGKLTGFDVDIAKALCAQIKAKCTIVAQDWDGIIPGLLAKKYDAIVASMSITDERKKKVDFTAPYYANYLQFVAKKGMKLDISKAGLKGKTIGAQRATISSQYLEKQYKDVVRIKVYGTQQAAWLDLQSGRVDAVLSDIYPAHDWIRKNPAFTFVGKKIDIGDKIGIAVRKDETALRDKLSKGIAALRANGTYQKINAKYFPFDIYK
jgi:lysine-arginine-ornithine-binding protein